MLTHITMNGIEHNVLGFEAASDGPCAVIDARAVPGFIEAQPTPPHVGYFAVGVRAVNGRGWKPVTGLLNVAVVHPFSLSARLWWRAAGFASAPQDVSAYDEIPDHVRGIIGMPRKVD